MDIMIQKYENYYKVKLAYSQEPLTDPISPTEFKEFIPTIYKPTTCNVIRDTGRALNGRAYSSILKKYYVGEFTISADEIYNDTILDFLQNFHKANYRYLAVKYPDHNTFSEYKEIIYTGDEFPISYEDDILIYPEFTIKYEYCEGVI